MFKFLFLFSVNLGLSFIISDYVEEGVGWD